jgi:HrpA-like RNA helicase
VDRDDASLISQLLEKRPDLRLILMSATGDFSVLQRLYANFKPATIKLDGTPQPLVTHFLSAPGTSIELSVWKLARQIILNKNGDLPSGDVLVFLPGEREIHQVSDMLIDLFKKYPIEAGNIQVLKLYRDLSEDEASLVLKDKFDANGNLCRKFIIATNVAETSVTFKNLDYAIDSGENRSVVYLPHTDAWAIVKAPNSRSQILQRFGRAGRRRPGIAIGLYTEPFFLGTLPHPEPPIRCTDLTPIVLTLVSLKVTDLSNFPWASKYDSSKLR